MFKKIHKHIQTHSNLQEVPLRSGIIMGPAISKEAAILVEPDAGKPEIDRVVGKQIVVSSRKSDDGGQGHNSTCDPKFLSHGSLRIRGPGRIPEVLDLLVRIRIGIDVDEPSARHGLQYRNIFDLQRIDGQNIPTQHH